MSNPTFQQPGQGLAVPRPSIPSFEGASVMSAVSKVTGSAPMTDSDVLLSIDDRVRMVGEYRVTGVNFKVDPKTGDTIREQVLKPIELSLCPWDPTDPSDNGVVHARPGHP